MLLMLPILALARGFGGFTAGQACLAAGIAFVAAAYAAALTLALASLVSGTAAAVVLSAVVQAILLAVFCVWLVPSLFASFVPSSNDLSDEIRWVLIHSLGLLTAVVQGRGMPWDMWAFYALARVLLCWACLKLAMVLMQRPAANPARYLKRALTAMDRYFLHFAGFGKRVLWKSGLGECRGNPIYWRERAISVVGQRDHMIRVLYGSAVLLSAVLTVALVTDWADIGGALAAIAVIGVPLLLAGLLMLVQPALAFAREKERGGLAALVVTPMTPRQFVMGKYWYALRSIAAPLAVGLGFWLMVEGFAPNSEIGREVWSFATVVLMVPLVVAVILYVAAGAQSAVSGIFGGVAVLAGLGLVLETFLWLGNLGRSRYGRFGYLDYILVHRYLWLGERPFGHSGEIMGCAFLLLLCSFLTAPYSKWMRNGLVIALFALLPAALGDIAQELFHSSMILAIPVALAAYMGIRLRKFHVAASVVAGAALVYAAGGAFPPFLILPMFLLACWRAARYADLGVFNRAFVAAALVGVSVSFVAAALEFSHSFFPLLILLIVGGAIAFLSFTVRQFDQLVERNG